MLRPVIILSLLISLSSTAEQSKAKSVLTKEVPKLELEEALAKVKKYQEMISVGVFIESFQLIREAEETYWLVGYRAIEHNTGLVILKVDMDGKISKHSIRKDG